MSSTRDYAVVTATYWAFTVTDGALRMLILLFLHEQGFAPLALASLFIFYEFFGIVTNLVGGWLGTRFGLKSTLFSGVTLQVVACSMLAISADALSVAFVMFAQALSGIAKDLTKMSSKSYVKVVVPDDDGQRLMRWVSWITGSKNTLKGVGFFVGGALLTSVGFRSACLGMAIALALAVVAAAALLPKSAGKLAAKAKFRSVFSDDARINWLAAARLFLFGARDVWFVVALPVFLASDLGWSFPAVGGFLALWVIGYGIVQASAPSFVGGRGGAPPTAGRLLAWTASLTLPLGAIIICLLAGLPAASTLIAGLAVFGVLFAANSAVHSFLIVAYADTDKVAMNVGFYYMANAAGRLAGTVLSGAVFQTAGLGVDGLIACIAVSIGFVATSLALCVPLRAAERRFNASPLASRNPQPR